MDVAYWETPIEIRPVAILLVRKVEGSYTILNVDSAMIAHNNIGGDGSSPR
jgi:hypothetical protein